VLSAAFQEQNFLTGLHHMTTNSTGRRKPRQLDVIFDTALAESAPSYLRPASLAKNVADLSTAAAGENVADLSTARRAKM
jgi:hypothetical protein